MRVEGSVRAVGYGPGPWLGRPRTALEVFETGYGHALDRAARARAGAADPVVSGLGRPRAPDTLQGSAGSP